ncbi:MAG: FAD-binding domain-containing protein [Pseudomonadota bacterium]
MPTPAPAHPSIFAPSRRDGLARLADFAPRAGRAYQANRNSDFGPDRRDATSLLSPWLAHGLIGEAEVLTSVLSAHGMSDAYKFVSEVFWRIYFQGHMEWKPAVWRAYVEARDADLARLDQDQGLRASYDAALAGRTGIDAFDAWAQELVDTGFLHNHTRMWVSSIWIFTLGLPWTLGADFFLRHLLDGDAASNTLNWRWTAGLHTKGKTYLATKANIRRYTDGRFAPDGLASEAPAVDEPVQLHRQKTLALPDAPIPDGPFALLVHERALAPETLDLAGRKPDLLIGVARPDARSPLGAAPAVASWTTAALDDALQRGQEAFDCPVTNWEEGTPLADLWPDGTLVVPYLGQGWLRDVIRDDLSAHAAHADCVRLLGPLDRAVWPHAKAGFFGVRKKMGELMAEAGLAV